MNIRIAKRDLDGLRERALEEGIPYQTLVSSILHKYVTGRLREVVERYKRCFRKRLLKYLEKS